MSALVLKAWRLGWLHGFTGKKPMPSEAATFADAVRAYMAGYGKGWYDMVTA